MDQQLLILAAALSAGLTVAVGLRTWNLSIAADDVTRSLDAYYRAGRGDGPDGTVERMGQAVLKRLPTGRFAMERYLAWIALEEPPPAPARVAGTAALLGLAGVVAAVINGIPALFVLGIVGFAYPFVRLRNRANRVKKRVERALPELSALMAAEMAAGNPPDRALERAGQWGGPLARLISMSVAESRLNGRPLFGRGRLPGIWREVVERYGLPSLRAFAAQVDIAAQKGAAGPELMEGLARSLIIAYKDQALREAEKLDSRLAVPSVLFFFLPFLFLILTPLLMPVMAVLG